VVIIVHVNTEAVTTQPEMCADLSVVSGASCSAEHHAD
jgi:hypothetical protein